MQRDLVAGLGVDADDIDLPPSRPGAVEVGGPALSGSNPWHQFDILERQLVREDRNLQSRPSTTFRNGQVRDIRYK